MGTGPDGDAGAINHRRNVVGRAPSMLKETMAPLPRAWP